VKHALEIKVAVLCGYSLRVSQDSQLRGFAVILEV